jgi:hypothetical protein
MQRAGILEAQTEPMTANHVGGNATDNASAVRLW